MQVRYKTTPNALIIYREKWGTLALGLLMGLVCVAFGVGFYGLMADHVGESRPFFRVFCGVFVLAGLAVLVRLPGQARQMMADDGLHILVADAQGITLSPNLGLNPGCTRGATLRTLFWQKSCASSSRTKPRISGAVW